MPALGGADLRGQLRGLGADLLQAHHVGRGRLQPRQEALLGGGAQPVHVHGRHGEHDGTIPARRREPVPGRRPHTVRCAVEIRKTRYDHPDAVKLTEQVQREYVERYGGPDATVMDADHFDGPQGEFMVGYVDGVPVATGGWRGQDALPEGFEDGDAELKRMYVVRRPAAGASRAGCSPRWRRCRRGRPHPDGAGDGGSSRRRSPSTPPAATRRGEVRLLPGSPTSVCLGKALRHRPRRPFPRSLGP